MNYDCEWRPRSHRFPMAWSERETRFLPCSIHCSYCGKWPSHLSIEMPDLLLQNAFREIALPNHSSNFHKRDRICDCRSKRWRRKRLQILLVKAEAEERDLMGCQPVSWYGPQTRIHIRDKSFTRLSLYGILLFQLPFLRCGYRGYIRTGLCRTFLLSFLSTVMYAMHVIFAM